MQQGCRQVRASTTMTLGGLHGVTTGRCIEVQWNYVAENGEREMWLCVFGLEFDSLLNTVEFFLIGLPMVSTQRTGKPLIFRIQVV